MEIDKRTRDGQNGGTVKIVCKNSLILNLHSAASRVQSSKITTEMLFDSFARIKTL